MSMCNKISVVSRYVSVINGVLSVFTEKVEGAEYAFYFVCKGQVQKKHYSPKNEVEFDFKLSDGFFSVIYFYRFSGRRIFSQKINYYKKGNNIKIIDSKVLFESKDNKIIHYNLGSETTFVVFNGTGSTKKSTPFGLNFLLSRGYNVISCLQDNNTQYQNLSFEDFRSAVIPCVDNKNVVCYGSSLGGYCAIYYAGAINASVIAAAPRNSAHPDIIQKKGGDSPFPLGLFKHGSIGENTLTEKSVTVLIDPYHVKDVSFYRNYIREFYKNRVSLIEIPHAGHEVLYYLKDTKQLSGLISSVVSEQSCEINTCVNSKYTDVGLVKHWLSIGDVEKARFYAQRAKSAGDLGKNFERRLKVLLANL